MRIAIVNDLPLAVAALRAALSQDPSHEIIWVAHNGADAVSACARDLPDVVLMDLVMPVMDGVEATRQIMANTPCAILIVTVNVDAHTSRVFDAMGHGAIDAVDTPTLAQGTQEATAAIMLRKLRNIGWLIGSRKIPAAASVAAAIHHSDRAPLIAIGASAGGPPTLATLLQGLPKDFPGAIVLIQHVDAVFAAGMADWLNGQSSLPVRLAKDGELPQAGQVLLAGTNDHLTLRADGRLHYQPEPIEYLYRPSIDVFFESVAKHWRARAMGALLTGMGRDGAQGLLLMRQAGFLTIAQDQATSAVYGMPKAAAAMNAAEEILGIDTIAPRILDWMSERPKPRALAKELK